MTIAERRSCERLDLEVPVMVSMLDEQGEQKSCRLITRDICSGGAFLPADSPFEEGTDVKMEIVLSFLKDNSKREKLKSLINVSGSVIRTEAAGMAVCFDKKYRISPYKS